MSYTVEFAELYDGIGLEVTNVDIAFALDTTCSMSEAATLAREFSDIGGTLRKYSQCRLWFCDLDDFNYSGAGADTPFALHDKILRI